MNQFPVTSLVSPERGILMKHQ